MIASLRRHWPAQAAKHAKVAKHAKAPHAEEQPEPACTGDCCPITLEPFVCAVVASDGRTYERDALMRHMAMNGVVSPLTRAPLEYMLYTRHGV